MLRKLKVKYYFWKLSRNKVDIRYVSLKLSVPPEKVREQYNKYKDPFKPLRIELLSVFVVICELIVSLFYAVEPVNEKNVEYEIAYKPDLRVYENDISISWDDDGWLIGSEDDFSRQYQDGGLHSIYLKINNVGTGNATDIKYEWCYQENIESFNLFLKNSNVTISFDKTEDLMYIKHAGQWTTMENVNNLADMESYLLSDSSTRFMIPAVYEELLAAYCCEVLPPSDEITYKESLTIQDFPKLYLLISYKNLQGIEIKKKVEIGFEPIAFEKDASGTGNGSWRIRNLGEQII